MCVIARYQNAGRGRHGRAWTSPPDAGLHFSLVLRPKIEMLFLPLITLMSGAAVHDTLEELYGLKCDIKWVNDIHIRCKKVSGILAERCETVKGSAVIVGIGINLKIADYPQELKTLITSVEAETGSVPQFEKLLETLTAKIKFFYRILHGENGVSEIRRMWTERSSYADGKRVSVESENEIIRGVTRGIEENGALRVETEQGEIKIVQAGEVSKLRRQV